MRFSIDNPGQIGIIRDMNPHELPPNAWSDGLNVRFDDGYAIRSEGEDLISTAEVSSEDKLVYYLTPVRTDSTYYWVYAGKREAWVTDLTSNSKIFTGTLANQYWSSGFLQGLLLLTNGVDTPQAWIPGIANTTEDLRYDLSASTSWADAAVSCKTLRTFNQYGVALDTTESGVRNSRRVWWSHPADAGATPTTWDYTKPQFDAGQVELDDDPEPVIDCHPLRGDNLIYKYNSIHRMTEIGSPFIFGFQRIFNSIGIRSRNCIQEFYGRHVVFGFEDAIVHDGQNHKNILDSKLRSWVINNIDQDNNDACLVAADYANQDMYFAFPEVGATYLTKAAVWNWREDTTSIRDLNNKTFLSSGIVAPTGAGTTFATDIGEFNEAVGPFDQQLYSQVLKAMFISDSLKNLTVFPGGDKVIGSDYTSFIERQGLPLPGVTGEANIKEMKFIKRIYPRIEGNVDVTIKLAEQHALNGPIKWHSFTFNPSTDYKIDCRVTTRVPGIWVGTTTGNQWRLHGIDLEYDHAGFR
jgi:hypothetical protein